MSNCSPEKHQFIPPPAAWELKKPNVLTIFPKGLKKKLLVNTLPTTREIK